MKTDFTPTTNIIDDDQLELAQGGWAFEAGQLLGEVVGHYAAEKAGYSFKKACENMH